MRSSGCVRSLSMLQCVVDGAALRNREFESENRQIFAHMHFGPSSGQGYHTGLRQIAKEDLRRGTFVYRRQCGNRSVGEDVRIGGERPKTLVHDPLLTAKRSYLAV